MVERFSEYVLRNKHLWYKNIHKVYNDFMYVMVILVRLGLMHEMRKRNGLGLGSPLCVDVNGFSLFIIYLQLQ